MKTGDTLAQGGGVSLFDGTSLSGWEVREGGEQWWSVENGLLTGGSLTEMVPHNSFLASSGSYENFELWFEVRLVKGEGFMNSGFQVRSQRVPDSHEMTGYQIDVGPGWWGKLYDESRRNRVLAGPVDPAAIAKVVEDWGWNRYRVLCQGARIQTWINGVKAIDYTEKDESIPRDGRIGMQAHGGGRFLVQFKDIEIRELPAAAGAPTGPDALEAKERSAIKPTKANKVDAQFQTKSEPWTPVEELASFRLPEGFVAELVTSEDQGVGKPITIQWDADGRLWTMTAYEYPLDGNENLEAAKAVYAAGGRDRVLVIDRPYGPGPYEVRSFADGLALPLGMLPAKGGAFVQYGEEIRFYHDQELNGTGDTFDVILEGFGIQDSHLFPHQFTRAPGGWIYCAQGLFNYSVVRRPGGAAFIGGETEIVFNQTKLARFRPDGSEFQLLTAGPNNIWGLVIARDGRTFIQEANDLGMPVVEYEPGTHYRTGSKEKLRPYAPQIPPSTKTPLMGGTGLSGLALAEDRDTPFQLGLSGEVFYVVNPIVNAIQVVTINPDAAGHYRYEKQEDFLVAGDTWFRPVAAHFGPDGCLYIVDWYNKIISHNEVPREHPDRDRVRGRIWRVRHQSQALVPPPTLTTLPSHEVAGYLGGDNALVSRLAWLELADREDRESVSELESIALGASGDGSDRRLGAFWALEGMGHLSPQLIIEFSRDARSTFRYEALRAAGEASLPEREFLAVAREAYADEDDRVRAALANAVRYHRAASPALIALVARLGRAPITSDGWDSYDRKFERYLSRWAMETHRSATLAMLNSKLGASLSLENRLLAIQALDSGQAAPQLVKVLPELQRPLDETEIALLSRELRQPAVLEGFNKLFADPERLDPMLRILNSFDASLVASSELTTVVESGCRALLLRDRSEGNLSLVVELARRYRATGLADEVQEWLGADREGDELAEGLAALREIGIRESLCYRDYLDHRNPNVRRQAVMGFAGADDSDVILDLAQRWHQLSSDLRQLAVDGMTSSSNKAESFLDALLVGHFDGYDSAVVEKLGAVLGPDHVSLQELMPAGEWLMRRVLRLTGMPNDRIETQIDLRGPFTLECWIQLDAGIDNHDGILGRRGGVDINFHEGKLRVFVDSGMGDVIVAQTPMKPHVWTHCAITRNGSGEMKIYLNGLLDQESCKPWKGDMLGLNMGETNQGGGCAARFMELRVWDVARSAEAIRDQFRTIYSGNEWPAHLVALISGDDPDLPTEGCAVVETLFNVPELLSPEQTSELVEKFDRYRHLAMREGDRVSGRTLFQTMCLACHQVNGEGQQIGPDLSGAGAMGVESLLRNILTPSAQLESGYHRHDLALKDGTLLSGFVVGENDYSLTIRPVGADERVVPHSEIETRKKSRLSLMPEGLMEGFSEKQVADLFSYLRTLR